MLQCFQIHSGFPLCNSPLEHFSLEICCIGVGDFGKALEDSPGSVREQTRCNTPHRHTLEDE
jgi:hypothetical protein